MRIPNINVASTFAGVSSQAAKETSDSSNAQAASGEATQKANATPTVEDVAESQQASDRDAQERYDGPSSTSVPASTATSAAEHSDREAPSVFDLPVEDDTPPPQLDTQA